MALLDRARLPLILVGMALCAVGVSVGLEEPFNGDSYCGQALWNGDTHICEQLTGYGVRSGLFIGLGLLCFALTFRRWLAASIAIAGFGLLGIAGLRAVQSPDTEHAGRNCGSLVGLGPDVSGVDSPFDVRGRECRDALIDQGVVVTGFVLLGLVLIRGSEQYAIGLTNLVRPISAPS